MQKKSRLLISAKLDGYLGDRLNKVIVEATARLGTMPFGIKTAIIEWALEEWLERYENDPKLFDELSKRIKRR